MGNDLSPTDHKVIGIRMAASIAAKCELVFADDMKPKAAAAAMKGIIVKAIQEHADAIAQSAWEMEREATDKN